MLAKSLAAEATREIERLLGADATQTLGDFEAAETAVRTAVLAVAARFVAERLNADHSDQHAAGRPCRCGHTARYAGRRAKTIVDIFHAKSHLWDVAKAIYTPGSDLAAQWAKQRRDELDAGRISAIVAALAHHAPTCDEARKCIDYLIRNRKRMRYPAFRASGLCVATGVVEAGCKHAVGARLKRAGMHWSVNGANAILALRCCILSGRFEAFWERRNTAHETAPHKSDVHPSQENELTSPPCCIMFIEYAPGPPLP